VVSIRMACGKLGGATRDHRGEKELADARKFVIEIGKKGSFAAPETT